MFDGKFTIGETQIPGFSEEPAFAKFCPNLSFKQRVMGFCGCAGMGWVLSLIGTMTLVSGPTPANLRTFSVLYVLGNLIALCATGFLLGPKSQCKKMWDQTRKYSTAFYLVMLIIVFSVALAKVNIGVVLVLLLIQIMAGIWYSASYIPFGRKIIITVLRNSICKPCFEAYDSMKGSGGGNGGGNGGFSRLSTQA